MHVYTFFPGVTQLSEMCSVAATQRWFWVRDAVALPCLGALAILELLFLNLGRTQLCDSYKT